MSDMDDDFFSKLLEVTHDAPVDSPEVLNCFRAIEERLHLPSGVPASMAYDVRRVAAMVLGGPGVDHQPYGGGIMLPTDDGRYRRMEYMISPIDGNPGSLGVHIYDEAKDLLVDDFKVDLS